MRQYGGSVSAWFLVAYSKQEPLPWSLTQWWQSKYRATKALCETKSCFLLQQVNNLKLIYPTLFMHFQCFSSIIDFNHVSICQLSFRTTPNQDSLQIFELLRIYDRPPVFGSIRSKDQRVAFTEEYDAE